MYCIRCGSQIDDGPSRFCPYCGASLPSRPQPEGVASTAAPEHEPVLPTAAMAHGGSSQPARARCAAHPGVEAVDLCSRCGAFVCRDCASRAQDGKVLCAACVARTGGAAWAVPWERRAELGRFKAYWETTRALLTRPGECFGNMAPASDSWWNPISYALVSGLLGFSGIALFYGVAAGVGGLGALLGGEDTALGAALAGGGLLITLAMLVFGAVMVPVSVFVSGGLEHLALKLFGARPRGFEATLRACCYAHAPHVLGIIPLCGYYVFPTWQLVLRILGYRGIHRTTGGKAAAAVLAPIGLAMVVAVVIYGLAMVAIMGLAAHD